jgi:hypothetical protein
MTAVSIEELLAKSGPANERAAALMVVTLDEAAVIGIFPYRKPRARRAPGLENYGIGFGLRSDPFEKIEYQCVDRIGHGSLRGCVGGVGCFASGRAPHSFQIVPAAAGWKQGFENRVENRNALDRRFFVN